MNLNIESREAHELAQELATLTGESMTAAVTEALRERLNRLRRERGGRLSDWRRRPATMIAGIPANAACRPQF